MARHPCSFALSDARLFDPEEVGIPVEMRLGVSRRLPCDAPWIAFRPGAQVVHYLHSLQVDRVVHVSPVRLVLELAVRDPRVACHSKLWISGTQSAILRPMAFLARRAELPVATGDRDRVLSVVDADAVAGFLIGLAGLVGLPVALGEVGIVDAGLAHPSRRCRAARLGPGSRMPWRARDAAT